MVVQCTASAFGCGRVSRSGLYKSRGVADWVGWETGPGPVRTAVVKLGQVSAQASEQVGWEPGG